MNDCYYDTRDWRSCKKEVSPLDFIRYIQIPLSLFSFSNPFEILIHCRVLKLTRADGGIPRVLETAGQ